MTFRKWVIPLDKGGKLSIPSIPYGFWQGRWLYCTVFSVILNNLNLFLYICLWRVVIYVLSGMKTMLNSTKQPPSTCLFKCQPMPLSDHWSPIHGYVKLCKYVSINKPVIGLDDGVLPVWHPASYLNQLWLIVNCIVGSKYQWNINDNKMIFILKKMDLKCLSAAWQPFCFWCQCVHGKCLLIHVNHWAIYWGLSARLQ